MGTTYKYIFDEFKDTITDSDLLLFGDELQDEMLIAILRKAISKCDRVVKKVIDLSDRDDVLMEFARDIPTDVLDILYEWMTVIWLKPYVNNLENLRNHMNTKDFTMYSPANLLEKISDRYENAKKYSRSLTNEFSFIHSDLENLKS
ncbi:hypothetical protein [Clostridium sp. 3-3]|uniref:hypothetical protein n=1 Tax=Clostridium sp. 3-3 TaxID=2070757 RepID=UPI000CDB36B6|nr:hypothetical protein [Clostridium sp. 3-3]POO87875.1 hypothetical protein C1H59_03670 [Clostridium sp. 3-3]